MADKVIVAHGVRFETEQIGLWAMENAETIGNISSREEMTVALLAQLHAAIKGLDLPYDHKQLLHKQRKLK